MDVSIRRSICMFCTILWVAGSLCADDIKIIVPSARSSALGGVHAAYSEDLSSLFNNPAGFVSVESQVSVAEVTVGASGPVSDIANIVIQAVGGTEIATLLGTSTVQDLIQNIYAAAEAVGPIYFGYVGKGLGFGFFNTSDVTLANNGPLSYNARVGEQLVLAGGYALRLPLGSDSQTIDVGILLKGALRGEVDFDISALELPALLSNLSLATVSAEPFRFTAGLGVDIGVRYAYRDVFAFGLAVRDLYTPTFIRDYSSLDVFLSGAETPTQSFGTLPIDVSAGILISPMLGRLGRYINDLDILLDYTDILDFIMHGATARNPILHVGLGVQLTLLQVLDLRMGFSDGLFSAGLGIDLTYFRLNASMFGSELSLEPGLRPVFNTMIGLEFRL